MQAPVPPAADRPPDEDPAIFREALRVGAPTLFGIGAWGLVVGVAMINSGLSLPLALGMTLLVFVSSGPAGLAAADRHRAPVWVVFATALVVNLRFVIFSALLAPHFVHRPWKERFLLGFVSGDITVNLFLQRFPTEEPPGKVSFLKGLIMPNWCAWQAYSIIGIFLGSMVPTHWGLGLALSTLAIICILVPAALTRASLAGVVVAGAVAVLAYRLPYKLGLLTAVLVGMLCAMAVEEWSGKGHKHD
ncbi:AzlC family ABC transporter permease [Massilia sp. H-1]|nr:AzlC family ABC transporter permease [Massilia sp. H-1]